MNWLTNFVRPKIRAFVGGNEVPDNLWSKCPSCSQMLFHKTLEDSMYVCPNCNKHLRISPGERIKYLFDEQSFSRIQYKKVCSDPLKFKDTKKYTDRLKDYRSKTSENDAIIIGCGQIHGLSVTAAVFNFDFMGGSMGMEVGEGIVAAANYAVEHKTPFIIVPCSGGARMQEGVFSLMQMPRTVAAINVVKSHALPYIVLLTDPTTGGVSASFALLGDVNIAEPEALIAFTGPRVIEGTIREKLPDGFQKSEYLLEHGMIDMVVHRKDLKEVISKLLSILYYNKTKCAIKRS